MDDRLKQRLVGAAVLVALAVIFLPMLLDGEPRPVERTVRLGLPERPAFEGEGETIPLLEEPEKTGERTPAEPAGNTSLDLLPQEPLAEVATATTTTAATPEPANESPVGSPADTQAEAQVPQETGTPPVSTSHETASVIEESTVTHPSPVAEPQTIAEPQGTRQPEAVATPPAPASAQPATTVDPASARGWWVQLGVFSRKNNAERLARRGVNAGFPCQVGVFTSGSRTLHRVRCGAWADQSTANQQQQKLLQKLGLKEARLFQAGAAEPALQARTDVAPALQGWAVQVGSFKARKNADKLTTRLRKLDFPAYVEPLENAQQTRYRVRVGPYADQAQAKQVLQRLARKAGLSQGMLVKSP